MQRDWDSDDFMSLETGCAVHGDHAMAVCPRCGAEFCLRCHPDSTLCPECDEEASHDDIESESADMEDADLASDIGRDELNGEMMDGDAAAGEEPHAIPVRASARPKTKLSSGNSGKPMSKKSARPAKTNKGPKANAGKCTNRLHVEMKSVRRNKKMK